MDFDQVPAKSDDAQMEVDGVPAVVLHDSAADLALLLDHLLPPTSTTISLQLASIDSMFSLLRLSKKYGAEDLTQLTMEEVDKHLAWRSHEDHSHLWAYRSAKRLVEIILVCAAQNLPQYLPYAFYRLATLDMKPSEWQHLARLPTADRMRIDLGRGPLTQATMRGMTQLLSAPACESCDRNQPWL